jgi:NAD(P)-dependent dehydrogenase (short-subunit alcohol dehydrogenase family)
MLLNKSMITNSSIDLMGKHILITGAGSGIGRATAMVLANAGATLCLVGRTQNELEAVFQELGTENKAHKIIIADVAEEDEMVAAYKELANEWNSIDGVVANAGINGVWAPLDEIGVDEWDETQAINLRGTFLTVKLALPLLKKNGGSVIIVSSVNGTRIFSNSGATAYSCSKAGQVAFAKMVALELAKDRIRVNVICPGAINSNIDDSTERRGPKDLHLPVEFPEGEVPLTQGKPGEAEDVARTILFLASDLSSHISGTEIYIDGAQSLLQG